MAGYIGSKAVNLSTTGADINGDANIDGDLSFGDNDKAIFGAGSDLQIYHDGSHSYIKDVGTGNFELSSNGDGFYFRDGSNNYLLTLSNGGPAQLWHNGSQKLATTSTGIQVTGNIANASGDLTIDVAGEINLDTDGAVVNFKDGGTTFGLVTQSSNDFVIRNPTSDKDLLFKGNDGGSTITALTLDMSQAGRATFNEGIVLKSSTGGDFGVNINTSSGDSMKLQVVDTGSAGAANGVITVTDGDLILSPSANVGIGTSSPNGKFETYSNAGVGGTNYSALVIDQTNESGAASLSLTSLFTNVNNTNKEVAAIKLGTVTDGGASPSADIRFETISSNTLSEAMRIDSSGNVLVGTTDNQPWDNSGTSTGAVLRSDGLISSATSGQSAIELNRLSSDGNIANFRRSGALVGSIGTVNGTLVIDGPTNNFGIGMGSGALLPRDSGSFTDNANDIGTVANRFDDIHATNGTIQTSDRNEKQDIAELTDAEQRVAVAAKGLLRKFRWRDAVEAKGDEARTHFGIIAQDLQAAFAAEGLDVGDYAMFISSTWTDEETGEERTRMGVRYSELLAFIIGAL
jgi:hypothetical protein